MPFAIFAVLKSFGSSVMGFLGKLNPWQLLLIAALLFGGIQTLRLKGEQRHAHKVEKQIAAINVELASTRNLVNRKNAELAQASAQLRKASDEENRRIAADARVIRLSGPGRAICNPVTPARSSGHVQGSALDDAPGPALPADERAAVPWNWIVDRAEEHDELRAEVDSWRNWYARLVEAWPKNKEAAAP